MKKEKKPLNKNDLVYSMVTRLMMRKSSNDNDEEITFNVELHNIATMQLTNGKFHK